MKLSILIPTLPERHQLLRRLKTILDRQKNDNVEVIIHDAGPSMTTGEKRNRLIESCEGEYFCFIDDDDLVPEYYVSEMLSAIDHDPDVVTFIGYMTTDGQKRQGFTIKLGSEYVTRNDHHYRFPNHLCAFKKSLVQSVKFPPIKVGEDYQWAKAINDRNILRKEIHITKNMYHYDFRSKKNAAIKIR